MDISARFDAVIRLDADVPALQHEGSWWSWGAVRALVDRVTALLGAAGVGPGDPVAIVMRNRPEVVAGLIAVLAGGGCVVPVSSIQPDELVVADLDRLPLRGVLAAPLDWARTGFADAARARSLVGIDLGSDVVPAAGGPSEHPSNRPSPVSQPGVAVLMPTSGTTGPPKRIPIRYDHVNGALDRIANYSAATGRALLGEPELRRGVALCTLPMAHIAGLWAVIQAIAEGRSISLLDRFAPAQWAALVAEHQVRFSGLPPTAVRMVLDSSIDPALLGSLRAVQCGTAPLDPAVAEAFFDRFGVPVLTSYGATEFPGGLAGWTLADHGRFWSAKRGSAGRPRPGIRLRVVDADSGAELPADSQGRLEVNSPQATAPADAGGWVRTNDIARIDADGFLFVVGRSDDAVIRGGFKIVPAVVEEVLVAHPAIDEVALVGLPDPRLGQVPVAAVTLVAPADPDELREWSRLRLPHYQVPVAFVVFDELPRTPSMKISKAELRHRLESALDRRES